LRSRIAHLHFLHFDSTHIPHDLRLFGHPMDVFPPDVFHLLSETQQPLRLPLCSVAGGPRAHVLAFLPRVGDDEVDFHRPFPSRATSRSHSTSAIASSSSAITYSTRARRLRVHLRPSGPSAPWGTLASSS